MDILVLDDCKFRLKKFRSNVVGASVTCVGSSVEAISQLDDHQFDVVFLDHDLDMNGPNAGTGMDVVFWIENEWPPGATNTLFVVHSLNLEKGREMYQRLKGHGLKVSAVMWAWMEEELLSKLVKTGEWEPLLSLVPWLDDPSDESL